MDAVVLGSSICDLERSCRDCGVEGADGISTSGIVGIVIAGVVGVRKESDVAVGLAIVGVD